MTIDDLTPDRDIADTLRAFDAARQVSRDDSDALARRIVNAAQPILAQRRGRTPWWMFAAEWSRALIPLGATAAVIAAALLLWAARTPGSRSVGQTVASERLTQTLLYSLVAPVEAHAVEPRPVRQ